MLTQFKNSLLPHIFEAHESSHSTFQKMDTNTCAHGIKFEIRWVMSKEHILRTALRLKRQDTLPSALLAGQSGSWLKNHCTTHRSAEIWL